MHKNKNIRNLTISPPSHAAETNGLDGQFITLPNTHVKIQQNTPAPLIQKRGKCQIESEIEMYRLIASNHKSTQKAILQPVFNKKNFFEPTLYSPVMRGGSLKLHQTFLFEQLKKTDKAALWIMQQLFSVLDALHHLHTATFGRDHCKGIIHGDIKPDNILINEKGDWILADFDCAYPATEPARQFGSLRYMAPELFAQMNFTQTPILNIDKSDIWSLGITLYRILNNKFPDFFNAGKSVKKNTNHNFFQAKLSNIRDNEMQPETIDLEDNINSFIFFKKWGENYHSSPIAKKAKESLEILQNNKKNNEAHLTQSDILTHLSIAMLGSIEERPNAEGLLTLMQVLQDFCPSNDHKYQQFITELLNHSPLNRETGDNRNLNLETEPMHKRTRSFS